MKKQLLSLCLIAASMSANAEDYTSSLFKTVNGVTTETTDVKATLESGAVTFEIPGEDAISFSISSSATKTVGFVTFYTAYNNYGFFKGELRTNSRDGECALTATFNQFGEGGAITTYHFGSQRYTYGQLLGSDFETFHTVKNGSVSSEEPDGWHSFMSSVTGKLTGSVKNKVFTSVCDEVRPGSTGSKSVKIESQTILKIPANGTLTTGRLHATSINKTDASSNNSTSDPSSTDVDAAGDPFYAPLAVCPDSIAVWVKFKQGTLSDANKGYKYATLNAVYTDGTKYQDPEETTYENVYGKATCNTIESKDFEWQRICVPFEYTSSSTDNAGAMLVTLSTNAQAGVGSTDSSNPDVLIVDDMELIYDTRLSAASFDGTAIEGFTPENTEYTVKYTGSLTNLDSRFSLTPRSRVIGWSTDLVEKDGQSDVVVTTVGYDLLTTTKYVFHMVKDEPQTEYTGSLAISINGEEQDPQTTTITTTKHDDGTYDLLLKQFTFGGADGYLIGDVTAKNIHAEEVDGYTVYTADQDAEITNGGVIAEALGGKVHIKLNAQSKDDKLYAEISLPVAMDEDDVMDVFAVFGEKFATGINSVKAANSNIRIYNASGMLMNQMQRGLNIVKNSDGKTIKMLKK
jgi:hypothetical protein